MLQAGVEQGRAACRGAAGGGYGGADDEVGDGAHGFERGLGLAVQLGLELGVAHVEHGEAFELFALAARDVEQRHAFALDVVVQPVRGACGHHVEAFDLFAGVQAEQAVAALDGVVQKGERAVLVQGDEPE